MTLAELNERIAGFNERENEYWQRFAQLTAHVIAHLSPGKRIRARNLLPQVFPALPVYTEEEKQAELDEIKKAVGLDN